MYESAIKSIFLDFPSPPLVHMNKKRINKNHIDHIVA